MNVMDKSGISAETASYHTVNKERQNSEANVIKQAGYWYCFWNSKKYQLLEYGYTLRLIS